MSPGVFPQEFDKGRPEGHSRVFSHINILGNLAELLGTEDYDTSKNIVHAGDKISSFSLKKIGTINKS